MSGPLAPYLARLDSAYRSRPLFVGLKARLLAAFCLLVLVFVPVNIAKTLLIHPPAFGPRILVNVVVGIAAWFCLRSVYQGHLERAGNRLALAMVLAVHVTVLVAGSMATQLSQPLSVGIQLFAFDLVFIIFALVFASRRIAIVAFLLMVAGHLGYALFLRNRGNLDASGQFSANVLLREGLFAMGFLFCLGITLSRMIEAALRRSEETLRQAQSVNENLERLVSDRTRDLEVASREATALHGPRANFSPT